MNTSSAPEGQAPEVSEAKPAEGQSPTASDEGQTQAQTAPQVDWQVEAEKWKADALKLRHEAASRRVSEKEAKERERAELERSGKFEELNAALAADLESAKGYEADATKWREFQAAESERLNAKAEALEEWQRRTFDMLPSLDAKRDFLENITAAQPEPKKKPLPQASATAAQTLDLATATPAQVEEMRQRNPEGYKAALMRRMGLSNKGSSLHAFLNGGQK